MLRLTGRSFNPLRALGHTTFYAEDRKLIKICLPSNIQNVRCTSKDGCVRQKINFKYSIQVLTPIFTFKSKNKIYTLYTLHDI